VALAPISPHDEFSVWAELQGLYDEISQATQQFETASDVDLIHDVLYTSDWVFFDATGQRHSWLQVREEAVRTLESPRVDSITQSIQTLSLVPTGATVRVNVTTCGPWSITMDGMVAKAVPTLWPRPQSFATAGLRSPTTGN